MANDAPGGAGSGAELHGADDGGGSTTRRRTRGPRGKLWVAVDVDVGEHPTVWRLVHALISAESGAPASRKMRDGRVVVGITEVVGMLALLWGRVLRHAPDGDVSEVPDDALDAWARWDGTPGAFGAAFRRLMVTDGVITDWDVWNGNLHAYRKRENDRKRENPTGGRARRRRGGAAESGRNGARDTAPDSAEYASDARTNGAHNGTSNSDSDSYKPQAAGNGAGNGAGGDAGTRALVEATVAEVRAVAGDFPAVREWAARRDGRPQLLLDCLAQVVAQRGRGAVHGYLEELQYSLTGKHQPQASDEGAEKGLREWLTDSREARRAVWGNWIRGARTGAPPSRRSSAGNGRARVDAAETYATTIDDVRGVFG